jgi:hypothetical protein
MKELFLIILAGVFLTSCKKEKIEIQQVEKEYNWKTHPNFLYENAVQMNSFSTNDCLFFYGIYKFSAFGTNAIEATFLDTITGVTMMNYFHLDQDQPPQYKFPISNNFFIDYLRADGFYSKEDKLCFVSSMNPYMSDTYVSFSIKDIDTSFMRFDFSYFSHDECIAINDNDQALIPYRGFSPGKSSLKLALVDIKVNSNPYVSIDTLKTKIITLDDERQIYALYVQHLVNDFFLTTDTKTYRINSAGEIAGVYNYHFYDIIEKQDTTFAVGYDFDLRQYEWSYSLDKGVSWNKVAKIMDQYEWLDYAIINNRIIGFLKSQIWQIKPTSNGFESIELDNDGLEGKQITSITGYKGKVYVSSLSGVFYKTMDDVFKVKENISK